MFHLKSSRSNFFKNSLDRTKKTQNLLFNLFCYIYYIYIVCGSLYYRNYKRDRIQISTHKRPEFFFGVKILQVFHVSAAIVKTKT